MLYFNEKQNWIANRDYPNLDPFRSQVHTHDSNSIDVRRTETGYEEPCREGNPNSYSLHFSILVVGKIYANNIQEHIN